MRTRGYLFLTGLAVGAALGLAWIQVWQQTRATVKEQGAVSGSIGVLESQQRELEKKDAALRAQIEARKLAAAAATSPADRARSTAGSYVARLKDAHALHPPPARRPPPPMAANGGMFFAELMSDPDYNAGFAAFQRASIDLRERPRLRQLDVPDDLIDKVLEVLTDREVSMLNLQSLGGRPSGQGLGGDEAHQAMALQAETQARIAALLGDDLNQRYQAATKNRGATYAVDGLELLLSYSAEPLTPTQKELLVGATLQAAGTRNSPLFSIEAAAPDSPVFEQYRKILSPAQMTAVIELHEEAEAASRRRSLPKG